MSTRSLEKRSLHPVTSKSLIKNGTILSGKDLAQSLNTFFLSVNNDISPLVPSLLPAYLPASQSIPNEVCVKMLSIKVSKSSSPGGILDRVIKDFAYEWTIPQLDKP